MAFFALRESERNVLMERRGDEVHLDYEEASSGVRGHGVRYVLAISIILAIGLLSAIWITGALTTGEDTETVHRAQGWSSITG